MEPALAAPLGAFAVRDTGGAQPDANWGRTLWSVLLVQSLLSSGATIIGPTTPLLLPELGVATDAGVRLWTGAILAVTPLTAAFTSPLWGVVAEKIGRRRVLAATGMATGALAVLMWLVGSAWQLLVLRILMGGFSGFAAAGLTLVSATAPPPKLGYALGWLAAGQIIGALLGPVLGGSVADLTDSVRAPFLVTSLLSLLAAGIATFAIPADPEPADAGAKRAPSLRLAMATVAGSPVLLVLCLALLFSNAGIRAGEPLVVLQAQRLLGDHASLATLAGVAVAISGVGNMMAGPFLGRRSDVIGYRRTLLISLAGAAAASVPQAFVDSYPLFVAERFFFGMFAGGVLPPLNALIARTAPPEQRATIFGLTASASFFGGFLGPISGGAIAAEMGLGAGFLLAAALMFACFVGVLAAVPADRKPVVAGLKTPESDA